MRVTGFKADLSVIDLVAHFLGIATHDNVNAAPLASVFPREPARKMRMRLVDTERPPKASGY